MKEAKELLDKIESAQAAHLFETGEYYEGRGYPVAALVYYQSVIQKFPLTKSVALAQKKLAEPWAKKALKKWMEKAKWGGIRG